ncbi:MAG: UvrB/UvrC motif-containing protein [Candidatus Brocadiia bacterium]
MDLAIVLDGWPYDKDDQTRNIRKVVGMDGHLKLQIRVRGGVIQWEVEGRPDGEKPYGYENVLDYCGELAERFKIIAEDQETKPDFLSASLLEELQSELLDYARRRQAFLLIGDYRRVVRDALHGLEIVDFVGKYATSTGARRRFTSQRPELVSDRARAEALLAIQREKLKNAVLALTHGIREIESFYRELGELKKIRECSERKLLIDFRRSLRERYHIPLTDGELLQTLQAEQQVAIEQEDFEMAARLKDKINKILSRMETQK